MSKSQHTKKMLFELSGLGTPDFSYEGSRIKNVNFVLVQAPVVSKVPIVPKSNKSSPKNEKRKI